MAFHVSPHFKSLYNLNVDTVMTYVRHDNLFDHVYKGVMSKLRKSFFLINYVVNRFYISRS